MYFTVQSFLKKSHPLISSENPLLKSCHAPSGRYKFSKILISTWRLESYHWQQTLSVVFLEMTGSLLSFFRKMPIRYSGLNYYSLSVVLSRKNRVPWKGSLFSLQLQQLRQCFSLRHHFSAQQCFMLTSHLIHRELKRCVIFSYKMNKFWGYKVQHGDYRQQNWTVYLKVAMRVEFQCSQHKSMKW